MKNRYQLRPQVFINFRGKDERKKLLPHLKHHLKDSNVNVFTDDDAVGEPLENLFKHIRRSRIVIVIFSINYLESEWCLDELVEIKKCLEVEKIDFAIPIFYKVKTSHVKEQSGEFGKRFIALQKKHRGSRIKRWKRALRFVAKSVGLTYKKRSSVSNLDFIKKIVERVNITLKKIESKDNDGNTSGMSKGETSNLGLVDVKNEHINLSNSLEALKLENSYLQGFISGSAWRNGIIASMQSSNSFVNSLQFDRNLQGSHILRNESLDQVTRNHIMDSTQNRGQAVDWRPNLSSNFQSLLEVPRPTGYRMLEPSVPQVWPNYRMYSYQCSSDIDEYYSSSPYDKSTFPHRIRLSSKRKGCDLEVLYLKKEKTSCDLVVGKRNRGCLGMVGKKRYMGCIPFIGYYFKLCFSHTWGASQEEEDIDNLWKTWSDFSLLTF